MSENWNPDALPFRPGGYDNGPLYAPTPSSPYYPDRREQNFNAFERQLPPPPPGPFGPPGAPWSVNSNPHNYAPSPLPPPPPPQQQMYSNNQQAYNDYAAHQQAQAYHQWMQGNGYNAPQNGYNTQGNGHNGYNAQHSGYSAHQAPPQPYGMHQHGQQQYGHQQAQYGAPPPFRQQQQHQQMFPSRAYYHTSMQAQANIPYGARNEDLQASTSPGMKLMSGASVNNQAKKDPSKAPNQPSTPAATGKKGRMGDEKIMLPAPQPTPEYLEQAAGEPSVTDSPSPLLVILDLNGTVLFRPNRNTKTMIERPFLKPFLRYLFENFKVMVWSSAKPDNVKSLVSQALDNHVKSKLVAQWARDSFGLSPTNYQQNVQVYKNLKLVWSRNQIQSFHPDYEAGARFGQHNTVLIDDSSIKASAQPYNLCEIPEFCATPEQMEGDMLREVAGYLEMLRQQTDVSQFIEKEPFKGDGRWTFDWTDEMAGGGEMTTKASAGSAIKKKSKKKQGKAVAGDSGTQTKLSEAIESMASVSLTASVQKDW